MGPLPTAADWFLSTGLWQVTFDLPLRSAMLNPSAWSLRVFLRNRIITGAQAVPNFVFGTSVPFGPNVSGSFIQYDPVVPDLFGLDGTPVRPFTFTPVTIHV